MDSQQQTKFYTVPEDVEISNLNLDESLNSISNNQKTSPPGINKYFIFFFKRFYFYCRNTKITNIDE